MSSFLPINSTSRAIETTATPETSATRTVTLPRSGADRTALLRSKLIAVTIAQRESFTKTQTPDAENTFAAMQYAVDNKRGWPEVFTRTRPEVWNYAAAFIAGGLPAFAAQFDVNYNALEIAGVQIWERVPNTDKNAFFARNPDLRPLRTLLDTVGDADIVAPNAARKQLRPIFAALAHCDAPLEGMRAAVQALTSLADVTIVLKQQRVANNPSSGARVASRSMRQYEQRAYEDSVEAQPSSLVVKLKVALPAAGLQQPRQAQTSPMRSSPSPDNDAGSCLVVDDRPMGSPFRAPVAQMMPRFSPPPSDVADMGDLFRAPVAQMMPRLSPSPSGFSLPPIQSLLVTPMGPHQLPPIYPSAQQNSAFSDTAFPSAQSLGKRQRTPNDSVDAEIVRHGVPPQRPAMYTNKRLGLVRSVTCTIAAKHFALASDVNPATQDFEEEMVVNGVAAPMTWMELRDMVRGNGDA